MQIKGWAEENGSLVSISDLKEMQGNKERITNLKGEFFIEWDDGSCARDTYGVMLGDCPPGTYISADNSHTPLSENHSLPRLPLSDAISAAVFLRKTENCVTALSGGVDSAFIAALSKTPCIAIGMENSHDLTQAARVASFCNLPLHTRLIHQSDIEEALPLVTRCTNHLSMTPVDIAIGITLWFIAETANEQGYTRILSGQRADELFGGYHRYADLLRHGDAGIARVFSQDWATIAHQNSRDQTIAGAHGSWISMPYLDIRVVEFCKSIAPSDHLMQGIRKYQLRNAACSYLPDDIAWQNKKAMQYGTGIAHELKRLAKSHGCGGVAEYVAKLSNTI